MASFSISLVLLFSLFLGHGLVELEASHHIYNQLQISQNITYNATDQAYRTGYHFQPPKNWINGVMIHKGIYHLFYQYNPKGVVWGNIVWAHSTSEDLINWISHEPAIFPSQKSDINGCWSGSATILPGDKPAILYTGIDPDKKQVQNLAFPKNLSDPYLKEWEKFPNNPLMAPNSKNGINASSFRDPSTAWQGPDKAWRVVIGSKNNDLGLAILYRSEDFITWSEAKRPLHSGKRTGMWECPDFYPVAVDNFTGLDTSTLGEKVKHVLKVSLDNYKHDYYTIGHYNYKTDKYVPDKGSIEGDKGLKYDYGKFYASKTFFDSAKNRRVLWGWINESSSVEDDVKKGWSGIQAIPRIVWLDKSGKQLMQWPVAELETLRDTKVNLENKSLDAGSFHEVTGITAAQADIDISFEITDINKAEVLHSKGKHAQKLCNEKNASGAKGGLGPFGLKVLATDDSKEFTAVFFRIFKRKSSKKPVVLMCSDQSRSSLNNNNDKTTYGAFVNVDPVSEKISLRSLIDHSIVASFGGGGKSCITARVYPTLAVEDKAHLYVFNNGSEAVKIVSLNAWSMKDAQIN
ncbi:beta-fructofuranosidase, insoluble isoenzyme CWINV1-like isoform X2 [Pistacia vera]|uniref:beta-fructofuranosidase, insoluble isoenzyme CWINV1-like isoform X2 n=1 Tax=Pistacia vera TaxID=55513 RepID=UPI0012639645|nr:beta-fructofuranosidase, insoluble isoenzyme CWINV1-like isoform X2 [Pistacia vera]